MTQTNLCCGVLSGPGGRRVASRLLPQDALPPSQGQPGSGGAEAPASGALAALGGKVGCPHRVPFLQ